MGSNSSVEEGSRGVVDNLDDDHPLAQGPHSSGGGITMISFVVVDDDDDDDDDDRGNCRKYCMRKQ